MAPWHPRFYSHWQQRLTQQGGRVRRLASAQDPGERVAVSSQLARETRGTTLEMLHEPPRCPGRGPRRGSSPAAACCGPPALFLGVRPLFRLLLRSLREPGEAGAGAPAPKWPGHPPAGAPRVPVSGAGGCVPSKDLGSAAKTRPLQRSPVGKRVLIPAHQSEQSPRRCSETPSLPPPRQQGPGAPPPWRSWCAGVQ